MAWLSRVTRVPPERGPGRARRRVVQRGEHDRSLAHGAVCLLLAASLGACGGSDDSDTARAPGPSPAGFSGVINLSQVKKELTVAVDDPHYLFHEDVFMAEKLGYFDEVGIDDVRIIETEEPLLGLMDGSLDLALDDTDRTIAAAESSGSGIKLLSIYLGGEANILGVGPGIDTVDDLTGTTLTGGQFGSRGDLLLRRLLEDNGLDPDVDVELVSTGGGADERLRSVIAGTVDGASLRLRDRNVLEAEGGKFLLEELDQVPHVAWSGSKELLMGSPETAAAFHVATLRARRYIVDQSKSEEVLDEAERLGFDLPEPFRAVYGDENDPEHHTVDGGFEVTDFDDYIATQQQLEVVPPGTDWRRHVDLTSLWRAQTNLETPLRPSPDEL